MNKKTIFLIVLLAVLVVPTFAYADLCSMVEKLSTSLQVLAASLATIAFIVSGVMFLSATGNPSNMSVAKASLIAGVIGIVIVLLAPQAAEFVGGLFGVSDASGGCSYNTTITSVV